MFALLGDIKFWSCDDNISIKDNDFGAFRYYDKKIEGLYEEGKKTYCHSRGIIHTPVNKKGKKLKDGLKYLEEQLRDHSIICSKWHDQSTIQLILNTGLLIYIQINVSTGDIDKLTFDKYLIGKVPDHLSDAVMTKDYLVCTQNDSQITILHFTKPKRQIFDKINKLEPKLITVDLSGPSGRRIEKQIQVNRTGDLYLIWWKSTTNDVFPWSPAMKEHDRANVHLYRLRGVKFELLCYLKTEFDPLCITFNPKQDYVIHSIEQKVSRKGEVTIEWQTYQVSQQDKLQRIEVISIPLPTHTSCAKFSPNQDMLLLCCIDGSVMIHDHTRGTNSSVKAGFIPTLASWHSDSFMFTIGNERGQCQHYDISLTCIKSQLLNEDSTQTSVLDLSSYFKSQPPLIQISWSKKINDELCYTGRYKNRDSLLLLSFERGPLGVIRIVEGSNLSADVLIFNYLNLSLPDRATSLLLSINWDTHPRICMHSLNQILNHLFKLPLIPERESLIQNALGSFHVPIRPISQAVEDEYGAEIRDLTRRFFHHLMRYKLFEKAFRLAIDLNDHDLFMDIHYYALVVNDHEMAKAAKEKAELVLSRSNSCTSSHSTCSRPSCSICSESGSGGDTESYTEESGSESPQRRSKFTRKPPISQIPPLPVLSSDAFNPSPLVSTSFNEDSLQTPQTSRINSSIPKYLQAPGKAFNYKFREFSHSNTSQLSQKSFTGMTNSFGNLKIGDLYGRDTGFRRAVSNDRFFNSENMKNPNMGNGLDQMSTKFDEVISVDIPNSIEYSFMGIDNNMTSTSFISDDNEQLAFPKIRNNENGPGEKPDDFGDVSKHFFNSDNNLVSTSFNEEVEEEIDDNGNDEEGLDNSEKDTSGNGSIEVPPPPLEMTSSLVNYLSTLPRKNLPLSRSTPGLSDMDDFMKFPRGNIPLGVQTQSSVSTILQNRRKINFGNSRTYRFNYDLDFGQDVTYSGSCDNLSSRGDHHGNFGGNLRIGEGRGSRSYGSGGGRGVGRDSRDIRTNPNVPPLPVIGGKGGTSQIDAFGGSEKPKVKFSNTVTHILLPESGPGYRAIQKRPASKLHPMDPKRELAESLPLCLGNEDYLKDFQPLSKDAGTEDTSKETVKAEETAKIKVVHFGLL